MISLEDIIFDVNRSKIDHLTEDELRMLLRYVARISYNCGLLEDVSNSERVKRILIKNAENVNIDKLTKFWEQ